MLIESIVVSIVPISPYVISREVPTEYPLPPLSRLILLSEISALILVTVAVPLRSP